MFDLEVKKKNELIKECVEIMKNKKVNSWYEENMRGKPQYETLNTLETAVVRGFLTVREALAIALVVGIQWEVKFPEVNVQNELERRARPPLGCAHEKVRK